MALRDHTCANHADTMKAMVGETIIGVIADYDGNWWLVVQSGHALVKSTKNGAFWVESPSAVQALIDKRKRDLGTWAAETQRLMAVEQLLPGGN